MYRRTDRIIITGVLAGIAALSAATAGAQAEQSCSALPAHHQLQTALAGARAQSNGGFNLDMWGTVVNRDGVVCAVAFTGGDRGDQWPGSRVISAQKANTANAFSLPGLALSTADLYAAVQPGGSLYGLQHSNPVDTEVAYKGSAVLFGSANDPLVGDRVGGVNVFGGGLGLYSHGGKKIGAVGVSGDTSCTDHFVAWRVRNILNFDHLGTLGVVPGADAAHPDNIIFDITANPDGGTGLSANGFGHPTCVNYNKNTASLPAVRN